jgi:uncharacterized membrane protein
LSPNNFSRILLSAVDESLSSLGESSKQAIFLHLESLFNIKREKIPANLTEFSKALEGILGPGASYLEKLIVSHLCRKLNLNLEDLECSDFQKCIDNVKRSATPKMGCS